MSKESAQQKADDAVETFLDGKYKSKVEMEKAFTELQKKLGEQGSELGTLRKSYDDQLKATQQYQAFAQQVNPLVQWYQTHRQDIEQWWTKRQTPATPSKPAGNMILTQEEQESLISQAEERAFRKNQEYVNQLLQQTVTQKHQEFEQAMTAREQAQLKLIWSQIERGLPEDKVKQLKEFNQKTLEYADTSKHDPMKSAEEIIGMRHQMDEMKKQMEDYKKQAEDASKRAIPSLGNRSVFKKPEPVAATQPTNRDSRFEAVMADLKNNYGADGIDKLTNG